MVRVKNITIKNFIWRTGLFLPAAIFAVYILMAVTGIIASIAGAGPVFYCTVFCKIGILLAIAVVAAVLFSK
ncbi:MAG: hypothetical protein H6556_30980 [Lewinellaceae bacterium]|nr:hypothetical protein [Lewinellaceae bacterium]